MKLSQTNRSWQNKSKALIMIMKALNEKITNIDRRANKAKDNRSAFLENDRRR
jgi:hypothetical protein